MDKRKRALKAKRKSERIKARDAENRRFAAQFNAKYKADGLKHNFKPADIGSAYREIQREIAEEAIITNTIATLYVMRSSAGYGAKRLHRLAGEIGVLISDIGKSRRTPEQLEELLIDDAQTDIQGLWGETPHQDKAEKVFVVLATSKQTLAIQATAVFYTLFPQGATARKSKKYEKIITDIIALVKYMVSTGKTEIYRKELAKCGFNIDMHGRFSSNALDDAEIKQMKRRIMA